MVWVCLTVRAGVKKARLEGLGGEWRKVHGLMLERELSPRSPGDADAGSRDRDVSPRIDELPRVHKGRVRPAVRRLAREKNVGSYSSPRAELHAYTVAGWFSEEGILPCGPPTLVAFTRSVVHTPWGKKVPWPGSQRGRLGRRKESTKRHAMSKHQLAHGYVLSVVLGLAGRVGSQWLLLQACECTREDLHFARGTAVKAVNPA